MITDSCDVIVIGAGPVGATAALLLAAYGLACTVIEVRRAPQSHPAAHVLSTRSMEIWRESVSNTISPAAAPDARVAKRPLLHQLGGSRTRTGAARRLTARADRCHRIGQPYPQCTPAAECPRTVAVAQALRDNARINLRTGWQYSSHTDGADGVSVTITDVTTGADQKSGRTLCHRRGWLGQHRSASTTGNDGRPGTPAHDQRAFFRGSRAFRHHRRGPVIWTHTAKGLGAFIVHRAPQDLYFRSPISRHSSRWTTSQPRSAAGISSTPSVTPMST